MRGVREAFGNFIFEHDAQDKAQSDVSNELGKMLKLRFKSNAPRRPPKVVLVGPPGSGCSTQAHAIAEYFGLVKVSVRDLLKEEVKRNPTNGRVISNCIDNGLAIPDNIVNKLVGDRVLASDCRVNGWVLEGFPKTKNQLNLLGALNIKPNSILVLDQSEEESIRRLDNKRIDPATGELFNNEINPPSDEATQNRLIKAAEDEEEIVKKRYELWKDTLPLLEDHFKMSLQLFQSDRPMEQMTEQLADAVQNPI